MHHGRVFQEPYYVFGALYNAGMFAETREDNAVVTRFQLALVTGDLFRCGHVRRRRFATSDFELENHTTYDQVYTNKEFSRTVLYVLLVRFL